MCQIQEINVVMIFMLHAKPYIISFPFKVSDKLRTLSLCVHTIAIPMDSFRSTFASQYNVNIQTILTRKKIRLNLTTCGMIRKYHKKVSNSRLCLSAHILRQLLSL